MLLDKIINALDDGLETLSPSNMMDQLKYKIKNKLNAKEEKRREEENTKNLKAKITEKISKNTEIVMR